MSTEDFKKDFEEFQEKHYFIMDHISDIVFRLNNMGFIEYVNASVEPRLGYKREELIGKHLKLTTPLEDVPKALSALKKVFSGDTIKNFEIKQKNAKGEILHAEINLTPIMKDGKVVFLQGVLRDVTKRKQFEKEMEEQVAKMEELNKHMTARELKIIELKKEVNELLKELGQPKRFNI